MSENKKALEFLLTNPTLNILDLMEEYANSKKIEHTRYWVEKALKEQAEKATAHAYYSSDDDGTYDAKVHKESILSFDYSQIK